MATTTEYLYERIYELLVDGAGVARTLASAQRFQRLRAPKGDRGTLEVRARVKPIVEVLITPTVRELGVADELANEHHYNLSVRLIRYYYLGYESIPASVEATKVRISDDYMRICAVLGHPSNLDETESADGTGLASNALVPVRSQLGSIDRVGDGLDRLVRVLDEFAGIFLYSPDG